MMGALRKTEAVAADTAHLMQLEIGGVDIGATI